MQFNFDCEQCLDCDRNGFSVLEGSCQNRIIPGYRLYVKEILDKMGQLSARAQNLPTVVTSTGQFFPSNYRLFIKAEGNRVFGYIKIGPKKLFLRDRLFNYHERKTLCVLDFYVYERVQRKGIGKQLFDYMLNYENINPDSLAYDRPTLRLLSFLKKNYGLDNYITQSNSFIIFDSFFSENSILNYDTEFDNDTYRVIQTLRTPEYFNTPNYPINNFRLNTSYRKLTDSQNNSKKYPILKSNEYENNYTEDEINRNNNNKNNNYNKLQRSMSPIGKQLIYNNDNNYANNNGNKNVYKNQDSQNYVEKRNNIDENEININKSNIRENELNNKAYIKNNNRYKDDELYNKRYNNSNLFDDKKVPENQYNNRNNLYRSHDYIYQKEYQDFPMNRRNNEKIYSNQYPENFDDNYKNNKDSDYYEKRKNRNTEYSDNYNINDYYDYYNDRRNYDNNMY